MHSSYNFGPKKVIVHDKKIRENAQKISDYLSSYGCTMAVSTKSLPLEQGILSLFPARYPVYEIRPDNLSILAANGFETISNLQLNSPLHSVMLTDVEEIRTAPIGARSYYIFFDFGDKREGFTPSEATHVISLLKERQIRNVILASNIGCLTDTNPTEAYFAHFLSLNKVFTENEIRVTAFSIGGSNCIPFIHSFKSPVRTEIRTGEAVLFGTYAGVQSNLLDLHKQNIFLEAWSLRPIGDNEVMFDFGYTHAEPKELLPSDYTIVRQSANHTTIRMDTTKIPERIYLPLHYRGLTKLGQQKNVLFENASKHERSRHSHIGTAANIHAKKNHVQ